MCKHEQEYKSWTYFNIDSFGRTARGETFKKLPPAPKPQLILLLPGVGIRNFSGGPNTALLLAAEFVKLGYEIRVCSLQARACDIESLYAHLTKMLHIAPEVASKFSLSDFHSGLFFHENDRIMATASWTLPTALDLCKNGAYPEPAYLIQDLEPLFLGFGTGHAYHMTNYGKNYLPIINTPALAELLFKIGDGIFVNDGFRKKALIFKPAVDQKEFYFEPKNKKKKIIGIYTRFHPRQARNMSDLAMEIISQACKKGKLEPEKWEVHCFGAPDHAPFRFSNGLQTIMLPWMDFSTYAKEVRKCDIGISLMCSPHTGYMPLEFAACGAETVTNTYLTKTVDYLKQLSPLFHAAPVDVAALTNAMLEALESLENQDARTLFNRDIPFLNLPSNWNDAFAPIMPELESWMK